jgi:lysophospholipase L1-like esterase
MSSKVSKKVLLAAALILGPSTAFARPKFLAMGDSYTFGAAVTETQRWPNELVRLLRDTNVEVADPDVIAKNGWTTGELLEGLAERKPEGPYGLVTLMIGTNNQFRGYPIDDYRKDVAKLLSEARRLAGGNAQRVVVVSIPDWSVTPFAAGRDVDSIAQDINAFNDVLLDETRKVRAMFVDVTITSRAVGTNPDLVGSDGLHPAAELHTVWARLVYPFARQILKAQ